MQGELGGHQASGEPTDDLSAGSMRTSEPEARGAGGAQGRQGRGSYHQVHSHLGLISKSLPWF